MKRFTTISLLIILFFAMGNAQDKYKDKDPVDDDLLKPAGIEDRAAGTHNAGNVGLFFENRGKLYPRRLSQGPCGGFGLVARGGLQSDDQFPSIGKTVLVEL